MNIGDKLKEARIKSRLSQEELAEKINVSRQTISNWERGKTYPDIGSIIILSDIYNISLDLLLKGDQEVVEHLQDSTNIVKSNKKLLTLVAINILLILLLFLFRNFIKLDKLFLFLFFAVTILISAFVFNEIIRRF